MEGLIIRQYQLSDKQKLLEILKLNVPDYFAESEVKDLDHYLDCEIENYFVATLNGELVGAGGINFELDYQIAKISWDFVLPALHGKGIGRELLTHRLNFLNTIATVEKVTVRTSQHAFQFYEKSGFILKEIRKDYWAKGFDLYSMVLA